MKNNLPVILLKGLIVLPYQEVRLELSNEISLRVIDISAINHLNHILIVCPKNQIEESPEVSDLPKVGVIGKIRTKIELPNGNFRIVIGGIERVKVEEYYNYHGELDVLGASVTKIELPKFKEVEETAKRKMLLSVLNKYINSSPNLSNSILGTIKDVVNLDKLTDMITTFVPISFEKKLEYMRELNPLKRAEKLITDLNIELEIVALDKKIENELKKGLEESQKEFILKEKIKEIKKELGEDDYKEKEVLEFKDILNKLELSKEIKNKFNREITKYELSSVNSPETGIIRNYLETVLNLPWNKLSEDETSLTKIEKELDKTHFGLNKSKERIVEYIASKKHNKDLSSPIICLVGPPGVGKTTLASSIAKALKKEFYKISVGGLNDSNELIGHRKTYLGANLGKIMQGLQRCNTKNPLILIDEVDKMVKDFKGDPASTLLDILDSSQNKKFIDNYIEEPFDLSQVLFILTANYEDNIPIELRDRLEIINLNSYTELEKTDIAFKYLIPRVLERYQINEKDITFKKDIILNIINLYTKEAGVRDLERKIDTIIRKIITNSEKTNSKLKINITKTDLIKYLGMPEYENEELFYDKPGIIKSLACTTYGGVVSQIECCLYSGDGNIKYTGLLGDSMKESVEVALSYIKSNSKYFNIKLEDLNKNDLHLHILEGGIKKEGTSTGINIVTAILSILLNKPISNKISMTGEISLSGLVLRVGGLKEKSIAAFNEGIETVYIPYGNKNDLENIPKEIKDKIKFILVKEYKEIYKDLFKKETI